MKVPGVSSKDTAATVASDMRSLGMYCHVEESHFETDHLFASLRQNMDGRRFYRNEKVEMVIFEWLRMEKPTFYSDGIFERVLSWEMHHCHKGLCCKYLCYSERLNLTLS